MCLIEKEDVIVPLMKLVVANCDQLLLNDNEYLTWIVLNNLIYTSLVIYVV